MNKIATIAGLAVAATAMSASADVLLNVDLSVVDTITITATAGLSSADTFGGDGTGVYLAEIFSTLFTDGISDSLVSGDLVANGDSSDGSPNLFTRSAGGFGLNIYSWTNDPVSNFVTGTTAFVGSATWTLDSADYADLLAGNSSGDIYAFADSDDDIAPGGIPIIGQWNVVPAPGAMALLGLGGIVAGRRRR